MIRTHSSRLSHHHARTLLERLPSDGSMDFYASMMLDLPVSRIAMLRRSGKGKKEGRNQ